MFRLSTTPIIRSTQNCNYSLRYSAATSLQRGQAWPRWREVAVQKIWPVPEAVVTVLCTLDDGCGWHLKHVEWTCRIINRLFCVASLWTVINIDQRCTEPKTQKRPSYSTENRSPALTCTIFCKKWMADKWSWKITSASLRVRGRITQTTAWPSFEIFLMTCTYTVHCTSFSIIRSGERKPWLQNDLELILTLYYRNKTVNVSVA